MVMTIFNTNPDTPPETVPVVSTDPLFGTEPF